MIQYAPIVLDMVPGPVEAVQRFLSFTHVCGLADVDTWGWEN